MENTLHTSVKLKSDMVCILKAGMDKESYRYATSHVRVTKRRFEVTNGRVAIVVKM